MRLSYSAGRKLLVGTLAAMVIFVVYETSVIDSRGVSSTGLSAGVKPGARVEFLATAYCKGQTTASGVAVRAGIAAADPDFLPEGTIFRIDGVPERLRGL